MSMGCTRLLLSDCKFQRYSRNQYMLIICRTGTAAVDMISKISLSREETHLVPLVCFHYFFDVCRHGSLYP